MSARIALRVEAPAWRRRLPAADKLVRRAARAALAAATYSRGEAQAGRGEAQAGRGEAQAGQGEAQAGQGEAQAGPRGELCLVLADDALQRKLNHDFRGHDKSTNVLSFGGAPASLGDVVLALETIAGEAEAQGKSLADHVAHLVVHGVLHLMGYDHETGGQARRMERLETEILAGLGIADPYRAAPSVAPPIRPSGRGARRRLRP